MTLEEKAGLFFHTMIAMGKDGELSDGDPVFGIASNEEYVVGRSMTHFNLLGVRADRAARSRAGTTSCRSSRRPRASASR